MKPLNQSAIFFFLLQPLLMLNGMARAKITQQPLVCRPHKSLPTQRTSPLQKQIQHAQPLSISPHPSPSVQKKFQSTLTAEMERKTWDLNPSLWFSWITLKSSFLNKPKYNVAKEYEKFQETLESRQGGIPFLIKLHTAISNIPDEVLLADLSPAIRECPSQYNWLSRIIELTNTIDYENQYEIIKGFLERLAKQPRFQSYMDTESIQWFESAIAERNLGAFDALIETVNVPEVLEQIYDVLEKKLNEEINLKSEYQLKQALAKEHNLPLIFDLHDLNHSINQLDYMKGKIAEKLLFFTFLRSHRAAYR